MKPWPVGFAALVLIGGMSTPKSTDGSVLVQTASGMIDGKAVSAQADFEIVGGKLQIVLANTGTRNDYTLAQVLTDISFNMAGVDFEVGQGSGSSVLVPAGSALYYEGNAGTENGPFDVSSEWGLAENTMLLGSDGSSEEFGPFDFSVTAASFGGSETTFATGSLGGVPGLDGADFGLISDPTNLNGPPLSNADYIVDSVVITLAAVDPITGEPLLLTDGDLLRIASPAFSYGSSHTGIFDGIPEPSSLTIWALLGLLAITVGWRRRKKQSPV